jgi:hypothetical protein
MQMTKTARLANFNMLTTLEKIKTHLLFYGVIESIEIEKEAEEDILTALETDGVENVKVDDGTLVIEYRD